MFYLTQLNEVYIANVLFTKSARTFICCPVFCFTLKISNDFASLISQGTNSHISGVREDIVSVP